MEMGQLVMRRCTFEDNHQGASCGQASGCSRCNGGGIYIRHEIVGRGWGGQGGGFDGPNGRLLLTLDDVSFEHNTATEGNGLYWEPQSGSDDSPVIYDNVAGVSFSYPGPEGLLGGRRLTENTTKSSPSARDE